MTDAPGKTSANLPLQVARIDVHVLRWPVQQPVRTSFGTMTDRPAVLLRIEDSEGAHGWGEAWCNFPTCGAEHRARLIETVLVPLLVGQRFDSAPAAWRLLTARTAVLGIQTGEPGPIAQAIAGVDIALHDLLARRAGVPLWRYLVGTTASQRAAPRIPVYASGINPDQPGEAVQRLRAEGHDAFKLKVGFGADRDLTNLRAVRDAAGARASVMVDANQAWDLGMARAMADRFADLTPAWLEEPMRADSSVADWQKLASMSPVPLAGGENVIGASAFDALIANGAMTVVQPDVAKWGGLSGVLPVIDRIQAAGLHYCPHYLGAGIGLMASAQLLAARPGGLLEIDANPNPLRSELFPPEASLRQGHLQLDERPGLGIEPDLLALRALCSRG